jgi:hypothetical protein
MTKEKVVAVEEASFGGPLEVMKNAFRPETTFHRNVALSFVIPSEAEGSAVRMSGFPRIKVVIEARSLILIRSA